MALKNFMAAARSELEASSASKQDNGGSRRSSASERPPRTIAPSTSIDVTSQLKGTLHCKETLRIDGRVKGEIFCDKMVIVGECAKVNATIVADTIQVSGEVKGDITASCKITLNRTARVTGDLSTPGIVIEEGAKLKGRIVIGSEEKAVQESKPVEQSRSDVKPVARPAPKAAAAAPA